MFDVFTNILVPDIRCVLDCHKKHHFIFVKYNTPPFLKYIILLIFYVH